MDDCALLDWPLGLQLVATHDMLAEGVHFTPDCPPADIGWKLVAVNLSDLAASGARPVGLLMGAGIGNERDPAWAREIVRGMAQAMARHDVPLLGGDTIRSGPASVLALTALGSVPAGKAFARTGAQPGDDLWVSGTIGDAGLGLQIALGRRAHDATLLKRYRRPTPRLAMGIALRGIATACMDVSDGLLLDASRLAMASGLAVGIESAAIPLSRQALGSGVAPLALAGMGDDCELLFSAPAVLRDSVLAAAGRSRTPVARIGDFSSGAGLRVDGASTDPVGYQHR